MREPDVVGSEVTSVHLEPRIVVGRRLPIRMRSSRLEAPTAPEAVALGHLATHVDDLPIPGKLPEDSADPQAREFLNRRFFRVRRHVAECRIRVDTAASQAGELARSDNAQARCC